MRIQKADLVDWEPLRMRSVTAEALGEDRKTALIEFLNKWFQDNAREERKDCDIRFWDVRSPPDGNVEALCEHLTGRSLRRLAGALERRFPEIQHLLIGDAIEGIPSGIEFRWCRLAAAEVALLDQVHELEAVAVSLDHVSFGQFLTFLQETGYRPQADQDEWDGYFKSHQEANWGDAPKVMAWGVSWHDAMAFCEWSGLRLPSEPELHQFFVERAETGKMPQFSGECWTSTPGPDGTYVLRNGPYARKLDMPIEHFRSNLSPDHYDYPFPSFRVAKSIGRSEEQGG